MTLIAGALARRPGVGLPAGTCEQIAASLSRDPRDRPLTHRGERVFFAKVDIGAYREPAFRVDADGSLSMLAGEPLLLPAEGEPTRTRTEDLHRLHDGWRTEPHSLLPAATGIFTVAHYDAQREQLTLATDKLALRPLFVWFGEELVVFSSVLRTFAALPQIPRTPDLRTLAELLTLHHALGDRTPSREIVRLRAGELAQVRGDEAVRSRYWRWDEVPVGEPTEAELLAEAYQRFTGAVRRRLGGDTVVPAFLSGGLDSRCVVGALRDQGATVYSFNFAREGTQDQVLGRLFAEAIGSIHHEEPRQPGEIGHATMLASRWSAVQERDGVAAERPSLIWSGDGGSGPVGFANMYPDVIERLRGGDVDGAIRRYLQRCHFVLPTRILTRAAAASMAVWPPQALQEELQALQADEPGRRFFLLRLLNMQHPAKAGHFANIDRHRLEYQIPFWDSHFLETIVRVPVDLLMRHHFYHRWLQLFPAAVSSVPWQAYPGHEPCPLPAPQGLQYQWGERSRSAEQRAKRRQRTVQKAQSALAREGFPHPVLNRRALLAATWAHRLRLRDASHLIDAASTVRAFWVPPR